MSDIKCITRYNEVIGKYRYIIEECNGFFNPIKSPALQGSVNGRSLVFGSCSSFEEAKNVVDTEAEKEENK